MKMSGAEFERQFVAATRRGEERLRNQPLATSVKYDTARGVVIQLNNDCLVCVPLSLLPELRGAAIKDLRRVKIMGVGQAIEWPSLDQQFDLLNLLADAVGAKVPSKEVGLRNSQEKPKANSASRTSGTLRKRKSVTAP